MKTIYGVCFALIAVFMSITPVAAATDWNTLPANDFIKTINSEIDNTQNVKIDSITASYVYKKMSDKKSVYYAGTSISGSFYNPTSNDSLSISSSTLVYEMGKAKPKAVYSMSVIADGKDIYFKVDGLKNKTLKNKWIKSNSAQYEILGTGLGATELFSAFNNSTEQEAKAKSEKISAAYIKTQYWEKYTEAITDDLTVANATRYNFEPRQSAIKPYFTEIENTLTLKEAGYGAKSFKDFLNKLSNNSVTEFIAENSYLSVWIDNVSKRPVRVVSVEWIPVTEKKKTVYVLNFSDTEFTGFNTQPKLILPATSTDAISAAKLLKIKL